VPLLDDLIVGEGPQLLPHDEQALGTHGQRTLVQQCPEILPVLQRNELVNDQPAPLELTLPLRRERLHVHAPQPKRHAGREGTLPVAGHGGAE